ncbi:MAG: esterase-like activity of phytase family protein [Pseudomonadota bacterium]
MADGLEIGSAAVEIAPAELTGLRLRGTRVLTADMDAFGGFSGLIVRDGRLLAVSDAGWFLDAPLAELPDGLEPGNAQFFPLTASDGSLLGKSGGDAEGLAVMDGEIWISFEGDHRVMRLGRAGVVEAIFQPPAFERLGSNKGLESLASHPAGGLMAIAEAPGQKGHPVFIWRDGSMRAAYLPADPPFYVTAADFGLDGRLYLVLRHYSPLTGVRIEIQRFSIDDSGFPDPATRQRLAAFESGTGIDNMEGISLWQDANGVTHLTLISDDNFNRVQRTLLMDFEVLD